MRFIVMHKVDASMEAGAPPSSSIIENMGAFIQETLKSGAMLNGAGLHKSARRARLECKGGECVVTKGPYPGKNELVASFVMISTRGVDDALRHAKRFGEAFGDVEIEVGPVVEPWDLGTMTRPAGNIPERFLFLVKATPFDERDPEACEKHRAAVQELARSFENDGVVLAAEVLAPSDQGARLAAGAQGKRSWVDGPFSESKELIAGFCMLELPSKQDAITWANRYAEILGDNEVDVRELRDA